MAPPSNSDERSLLADIGWLLAFSTVLWALILLAFNAVR